MVWQRRSFKERFQYRAQQAKPGSVRVDKQTGEIKALSDFARGVNLGRNLQANEDLRMNIFHKQGKEALKKFDKAHPKKIRNRGSSDNLPTIFGDY